MTVAAGSSSSSSSPSSSSSSSSSVIYFLHTLSGRSLRYVADLESRADLGTIAGFFSLNPISLRLNAHFISSSGGDGDGRRMRGGEGEGIERRSKQRHGHRSSLSLCLRLCLRLRLWRLIDSFCSFNFSSVFRFGLFLFLFHVCYMSCTVNSEDLS